MKYFMLLFLTFFNQNERIETNDKLFVVYTVNCNYPMNRVFINLQLSDYGTRPISIPNNPARFYETEFNSFITQPIELWKSVRSRNYLCDTLPIQVHIRLRLRAKELLYSDKYYNDTLFYSYNSDTLYQTLNINFTNEEVLQMLNNN